MDVSMITNISASTFPQSYSTAAVTENPDEVQNGRTAEVGIVEEQRVGSQIAKHCAVAMSLKKKHMKAQSTSRLIFLLVKLRLGGWAVGRLSG